LDGKTISMNISDKRKAIQQRDLLLSKKV
jgi:hypothetical protein